MRTAAITVASGMCREIPIPPLSSAPSRHRFDHFGGDIFEPTPVSTVADMRGAHLVHH